MTYCVKPSAHRKYVRDLRRQLPEGVQIGMIEVPSESGAPSRLINKTHPAVLGPDGELLRGADGRIVYIAGTPGSRRSFMNDLRCIQKALANREVA